MPQERSLLHGWRGRALLASILLAGVGYLLGSLWSGWAGVAASLERVRPLDIALLLALSLTNYGLRFVRWQRYLALFGHRVPTLASLRIYLGGFALTTTPGKAGEALRSLYLARRGVPVPQSLAALVSERLYDLLAVVLLASIGLSAYPAARPAVLALLAALAVVLVLLGRERLLDALGRGAGRLGGRIGKVAAGAVETLRHSGRTLRPAVMAYSLLLGVAAWAAEGIAFHYLLGVMGLAVPLGGALFIYCFAMLVGALSFLPGGLGGAEATMVALLIALGAGRPEAVAATVLIRLATLWFAVALGLLALLGRGEP